MNYTKATTISQEKIMRMSPRRQKKCRQFLRNSGMVVSHNSFAWHKPCPQIVGIDLASGPDRTVSYVPKYVPISSVAFDPMEARIQRAFDRVMAIVDNQSGLTDYDGSICP